MDKAFVVSKQQDGLVVRVGDDGVWLEFRSLVGKSYVLNISEQFVRTYDLAGGLRAWRTDMLTAAGVLTNG